MTSQLTVAQMTCARCGDTKLLSEFTRDQRLKSGYRRLCKACNLERVRAFQERRQAEIGDEAFRAEMREAQRRSRAKFGGMRPRDRVYNAARQEATRQLVKRHPKEFDELLRVALYQPSDQHNPTHQPNRTHQQAPR